MLGIILVLSSCGSSKSLYSWHNYENKAYQYMKKQSDESLEDLMKSYNKVIENQKGERKSTPPGVYAEKGYVLIKEGQVDEGLPLLKKEIELYPESEEFIGRIIKQLEQ